MPLITLNNINVAFAGPPLLDGANLIVDEGERIGLLGRNGAGKTTLLRILEGTLEPDSGETVRRTELKTASLPQDVPPGPAGTVGEFLHQVCGVAASDAGWEIESRIDASARDFLLDLAAPLQTLSAGSRRRVLLAAALVRDPDLLLLDEPTNHLDIDTIRRLEETLLRRSGALVFVTHDRAFLRRLGTRILELDRGALRSYRFGYDAYLEARADEARVEAERDRVFDRKLEQEEAWVRRGIKARRTRNEGRVRALLELRRERTRRRDETGAVKAQLLEAERSGRVALRVRDLGFSFDGQTGGSATRTSRGPEVLLGGRPGQESSEQSGEPIVRGLSLTILRGDRIGLLGPNGCGKTTLVRLLLGELPPSEGTVTPGTKLEVAHFEQLHESLDPARTVVENLAEGRETIPVGEGQRHVVGYLRDFLFSTEQIQGPITKLSGGERRRLQLAKVLSRPCNFLVLDEPTNDLDLETLELIEDLLLDYQGTLLVISHDRAFLDNVVTSTVVFEGKGQWREYAGGYEDWVRQAGADPSRAGTGAGGQAGSAAPGKGGASGRGGATAKEVASGRGAAGQDASRPPDRVRLSFKQKRELEAMPELIESLEQERRRLTTLMASPSFYATRGEEVAETTRQLAAVEEDIRKAYDRWIELEELAGGGKESAPPAGNG